MVRTQIQLPEEQVALLKKLAADHHTSMAEMIRQAISLFAKAQGAGSDAELRRRALLASGRFRSGVDDLAARHDEYLAKAFGG